MEVNKTMDPLVQKKKKAILCLGVLLYFLTTMSKVLVPATILDELLGLGTLSMVQISLLGGCFWYAYAISQLLAGIFSDRYGGVRILLLGGSFFTIGALGFPLSTSFSQMLCFRILAGLGAGTAFLGIAKLLADLYSRNYSIAMGTVLFIAFLGTPCGIGLYMAKRAADALSIRIGVESKLGKGTRFTLYFPDCEREIYK